MTAGFDRRRRALLRRNLSAVHELLTERPKLAGVGIATDVLDAVTQGA